MHVVDAKLAHFHALIVQPWQRAHADLLRDDRYLADLLAHGPAWAVLDGDYVLCVGGALDKGGGRAECWAWLTGELGNRMLTVHRAALRFLNSVPFRRLEMYVHEKHWQCIRWACALHFQLECQRLASWFEDGSAAMLFARVR